MRDSKTTLADIKSIVREFVDQRDWQQFHSPKNLSMALAIEAAELMEHFQWISMEDSRQADPQRMEEIGEEKACASPNKGNLCNVRFRVQMVF